MTITDQRAEPDMDGWALPEILRRYPTTTIYLVLALLVIGSVGLAGVIR